MCRITSDLSVTKEGYKVLAYDKVNKKFYSTFTGQEIGVGKVPMPPEKCNRLTYGWTNELDGMLFKNVPCFNPSFVGKTAAYLEIESAKVLLESFIDYNETAENPERFAKWNDWYVIVKVTFSGDVYRGWSAFLQRVIAGDTIESLEIINDEVCY